MRSTIERLESYGPAAIVIDSKRAVSHDLRRSKDLEPDTAGRRVSASTARAQRFGHKADRGVRRGLLDCEPRNSGLRLRSELAAHYSSTGRPSLLRHERMMVTVAIKCRSIRGLRTPSRLSQKPARKCPIRDSQEIAGAGVAMDWIQPPDQPPVADERHLSFELVRKPLLVTEEAHSRSGQCETKPDLCSAHKGNFERWWEAWSLSWSSRV